MIWSFVIFSLQEIYNKAYRVGVRRMTPLEDTSLKVWSSASPVEPSFPEEVAPSLGLVFETAYHNPRFC